MRVAHCDFGDSWRGGQQQLLLLAQGLDRLGWKQYFVVPNPALAARFEQAGFECGKPNLTSVARVRDCNVVHAHDGRSHSWMLAATVGARRQYVLTRRVAFPILGSLSRWKYRRTGTVIAVSNFVRDQVLSTGIAPERVHAVYDGVDTAALPQPGVARAAVRGRLGLSGGERCVVCVSAFTAEKGVGDLVEALSRVIPHCILLLTGDGPLRHELMEMARGFGVKNRVRMVSDIGFTVPEWIAAGDVFVMPSREEGLGSALLPALALGCPVVATQVGGIPEMITHRQNGILVEADNVTEMALEIGRILTDEKLALWLASHGQVTVAERFGVEAMVAGTVAAYQHAKISPPGAVAKW